MSSAATGKIVASPMMPLRNRASAAAGRVARLRERLLGGYSPLRRLWRRYRPLWAWQRSATARATLPVIRQQGLEVAAGPFRGMRYPEEAVGRATWLAPKLLGTYEGELEDVLANVIAEHPPNIVNIGAGEGFYAVGLALRSPDSRVYAFETDTGERRLCRSMAKRNGVSERVVVEGTCDLVHLSRLAARIGNEPSFVLCDCEGCELHLLRMDAVPFLESATLLVELHPSADPMIPSVIAAQFRSTHELITIPRLGEGVSPPNKRRRRARVPTAWAYLTPRAVPQSDLHHQSPKARG